ncbi:MAG: YfhO family protein [Bacilli bacterium]|nr:YfhO family protein [Bacilli bacterium]
MRSTKKKVKSKDLKFYCFIIFYVIFLIAILMGKNVIYGSKIDWFNQHTVIPEYFRSLFYETKRLVPNFAFGIGAGQNIFNFAYYGLLSPIVLLSYVFFFMDMRTYIMMASIILYIMSGICCFKFLRINKFNSILSFFASIVLLTMAPLTFHFHRHIMFVFYMPFLLMGLIGVDRYLDKSKSGLLIVSLFLIIMTNYYYGICSMIVVFIYAIYKMLCKNKFNFKELFKIIIRFVIPVLMAFIVLLPTAYTILNSGRGSKTVVSLSKLLIPNFSEIFYSSYSMGLIGMFLVATIGIMCTKKRCFANLFLGSVLLLIVFLPVFMFILNGFLYVRGKVLIPFIPLFIFVLVKFINSLIHKEVDIKLLSLSVIIFSLLSVIVNYKNLFYCIDIILANMLVIWYFRHGNIKVIMGSVLLLLFIVSAIVNTQEKYVNMSYYNKDRDSNSSKLYEEIDDDSFYRSSDLAITDGFNKVYGGNYNGTSLYSSTYNPYYWDFYNKSFGNNLRYRNMLITNGAKNYLFDVFMGVKYITSKDRPGFGYYSINKRGNVNLYYNENAFPVVYTSNRLLSLKDYKNLEFPYNMEYLLNGSVVDLEGNYSIDSKIKEYDLERNSSYDFKTLKPLVYEFNLPNDLKGKNLIISFDMNYEESCKNGDTSITINGVKNTLTCRTWRYKNRNKNFKYVIPVYEDTDKLVVGITKGKYKIDNIKTYVMDYETAKFDTVNDLKINKSSSTISFNTNTSDNEYVITSFPYDDGFSVYVDGEMVKKEVVNTAFLGFKLEPGKHNVLIKYVAPFYKCGVFVSLIGLISFIFLVVFELFYNKHKNKKA